MSVRLIFCVMFGRSRLIQRSKTLIWPLNSDVSVFFKRLKIGLLKRAWLKRTGFISEQVPCVGSVVGMAEHQRSARSIVSAVLVALLLSVGFNPVAQAQPELPDIGSNIPDKVTMNNEYRLGRAWLRHFRAQTSIIYDPVLQNYLEELTHKLAVEAELYERRLNLIAVSADTINAFAVPGGVIGVHSALLLQAKDEDMVASVMAHELAHLSQRHYARSVEAAREQQASLFSMLLAGLVLSANGQGDAASAAIVSSQALALQNRLRFSRLHEQEADAIGFEVLQKAGFDSRGMAQMFELLQEQSRTQGGNAPEFLLTHPLTQSRIAFAKDRERAATEEDYASLTFQLSRAHALIHQVKGTEMVPAREAFLASVPESLRITVTLYTDILLSLHDDDLNQAQVLAEKLALQPSHLYFRLAKARILVASGQVESAIQLLRAQLEQTPDSYPVKSMLAAYYRESGQTEASIRLYRDLLDARPEDPWLWQQLALSAKQNQDLLLVYQANAEHDQLTGDMSQAIAQLKLARESSAEGTLEHARISHRVKELQTLFKQMKSGG